MTKPKLREVRLDDKYTLDSTDAYLTGIEAAWLTGGAAFYFYLAGLPVEGAWNALDILTVYLEGWLLGLVSIWSPQGLGVREGVFVVGLGRFITAVDAVLISVIARVTVFLVDLVLCMAFLPVQDGRPGDHAAPAA